MDALSLFHLYKISSKRLIQNILRIFYYFLETLIEEMRKKEKKKMSNPFLTTPRYNILMRKAKEPIKSNVVIKTRQ